MDQKRKSKWAIAVIPDLGVTNTKNRREISIIVEPEVILFPFFIP